MKTKSCLFILILAVLLSGETENSREDIKMRLVNSYDMRPSGLDIDSKKHLEALKSWLKYHSEELGITKEELMCSTSVILREIEPEIKKWPQRIAENSKGRSFLIMVYILCIEGDTTAINTMKKLLHGVNGNKLLTKFAAEALFQSSAPWYPVAEYIADSGSGDLRFLLYASYLKNYVLEKNNTDEIKDSVAQIVCRGMLKEIEPTKLIYADSLLIKYISSNYSYCKERAFILKKRIESEELQNFISERKYLLGHYKHLKNSVRNILKSPKLHSSPRFRKYFNIAEDLDTVDIHFDEND
ncbi:MAG TPA: hypothetical protein VKY57_03930 [Chitinispirillaceae bacterium]|nr:hypothetical protein [Chitinispirillaceae bacterium]